MVYGGAGGRVGACRGFVSPSTSEWFTAPFKVSSVGWNGGGKGGGCLGVGVPTCPVGEVPARRISVLPRVLTNPPD